MKTIAVFVHSLTVEYSLNVLNGVTDYFKNKNVRLIICQTKEPHCHIGVYEYQCWSGAEYLFSKQIDAYIIIAGSYSSAINDRTLSKALEKVGNRPVISIGMELNLPNAYHIKTDCKSSYKNIVQHFVNKHNCTKIAFMSANTTLSSEAKERFDAYKEALAANGLEYDENLVLYGNFTTNSAIQAINSKYKSKADVPFDAIMCANDLMAVGVQTALQKLGFFIPDEIKIFGFDETSHATSAKPKLSTVDQNIFMQGYQAGVLAESIFDGKPCKRTIELQVKNLYRQSCGCISLMNNDNVHLDDKGLMRFRTETRESQLNIFGQYSNFLNCLDDIYTLSDMANSASTLRQSFFTLSYMMETAALEDMLVCFAENEREFHKEDEIKNPNHLRLSMFIDRVVKTPEDEGKDKAIYEPGYTFKPAELIFPDQIVKPHAGIYILSPIFSGKMNYGYYIGKIRTQNFAIYTIFSKIIINALSQAYEFTKTVERNQTLEEENVQLLHDNTDLNLKSKTDELTKILNRRGFMNQAEKTINFSTSSGGTGLVFFADMDGLKKINDTYGHKIGDKAIKIMASVLSKAFRSNDVVGRLSGDEFGIVAPGLKPTLVDKLKDKINSLCSTESQNGALPFTLSCSFGYSEFSKSNSSLPDLLIKADEMLYIEKKEKHKK